MTLSNARTNHGIVISRCFVRSKIDGMTAIASIFSTIQATAPQNDIAHRDRDGRHHQQRLDDQERHQKDEQHQRRRQPVDHRDEGRLELSHGMNATIRRPTAASASQTQATARKTIASARSAVRLTL